MSGPPDLPGAPALPGAPPAVPVRPRKSVVREYAEALVVAVVLVVVVRTFLFQAFRIPSASMEDTLLIGDFLFVNKALYGAQIPFTESRLPGFRDPRRGDVVVFQYPKDPDRDFIKRVIGTPGDTLEVRGAVVHVNGAPVPESYTKFTAPRRFDEGAGGPGIPPRGMSPRDHYGPVVVPPDQYFVMGDNRDQSDDSRFWGFLPGKLVRGKAVFIYFSFDVKKRFPRFSRFGRPIR